MLEFLSGMNDEGCEDHIVGMFCKALGGSSHAHQPFRKLGKPERIYIVLVKQAGRQKMLKNSRLATDDLRHLLTDNLHDPDIRAVYKPEPNISRAFHFRPVIVGKSYLSQR